MINHLIKNEKDHNKALSRIKHLMDAKPDTAEMDELELLTTLVEKYEERHFPINWPDPIDAIKFRMDQMGLVPKDMVPYIGNKSKVSEVLNGKRPLTLSMMRGLHKGLGIPAEVLLKKPGGQFPETLSDTDWSRFPVREIIARRWVPMVKYVQEKEEEAMRLFVEAAGGFDAVPIPLLRQGIAGRLNAKADRYAVLAWCMRVSALALRNPLEIPFQKKNLTLATLKDIAKLSYLQEGPLLAREYLAKQGIHLIIVPHLKKTNLDGGAMLLFERNAIIAMTLRYDRIDNFWFTLLHELAHLARHLSRRRQLIVDELDPRSYSKDGQNDIENEADDMASEALIPKRYWPELDIEKIPKTAGVISFAYKIRTHPALIAGRIRFNHNNYRILSNLLGHGQIRKHFPEYAQETTI